MTDRLDQIDTVLDGLTDPTLREVADATREFNTRDVASVATKRALDAGGAAPGGAQILSAEATIDDAVFKTIVTTPYELVAAPGTGKIIVPISAFLVLDTTAGTYDAPSAGAELGLGALVPGEILDYLYEPANNSLTSFLQSGGAYTAAMSAQQSSDGIATYAQGGLYEASTLEDAPLKLIAINSTGPPDFLPAEFSGGNAANTLYMKVVYMIADLS